MGMREKLIELISQIQYMGGLESRLAYHLIANGVRIPVLCKDCKNRDEITGECKHPKAVGWDVLIPDDNDFCSYGERRTDDE